MRLHPKKVVLVFALALPLAFGAGWVAGSSGSDPPAAVVNGEVIRTSELERELASRFGADVLNDMVDARLVAQEAAKRKLTLQPEELKKRLDEMVTEPRVKAMLEAGRLKRTDLERNLRTVLLLDKLILAGITTEQQRTYFEVHKEEFEMISARHILTATEEEATRLQEQLSEGADFARLAQEYSLDPTSKDKGGDLGFFRRGELDPHLVEIAFQTEVGEVAPVVPTRFGFHLVQVTGRKDDFKSLQPQVREAMVESRRTEFVKALEKGANIERKLVVPASVEEHP